MASLILLIGIKNIMSKQAYTYYSLDILHIGHIKMMKKCREIIGLEGKLIAGILTDKAIKEKKLKPILCFKERFEIASSIKFFDQVIPQETYSPLDNIKKIKPDILMESSSHEKKEIIKLEEYMKNFNGKVIVVPYYNGQSSTKIKKTIWKQLKYEK